MNFAPNSGLTLPLDPHLVSLNAITVNQGEIDLTPAELATQSGKPEVYFEIED